MKRVLISVWLVANLAGSGSRLGTNDVKDKQAIVKQARAAYYNLPRLGVTGYRCEVVTDWRTTLANLVDPEVLNGEQGSRALQALGSIHMWMTVDKSGDPKLAHKIDEVAMNSQARELIDRLVRMQESVLTRKAHELNQQLIIGMLPYPEESYTLEEKDGGYVVVMTEGSSRITIRMGKDFKITEFAAELPAGTMKLSPQYTETPQGLLLVSERVETHTNPHDSGTNSESLEYSDVGGVRIPTKITSVIMVDREPSKKPRQMILEFKSCELQKAN